MNGLHKTYLKCVDAQMKEYLSNPAARAANKDAEFCSTEKDAYMSSIKTNFPHQYNNILRVEANTYWEMPMRRDEMINIFKYIILTQI